MVSNVFLFFKYLWFGNYLRIECMKYIDPLLWVMMSDGIF